MRHWCCSAGHLQPTVWGRGRGRWGALLSRAAEWVAGSQRLAIYRVFVLLIVRVRCMCLCFSVSVLMPLLFNIVRLCVCLSVCRAAACSVDRFFKTRAWMVFVESLLDFCYRASDGILLSLLFWWMNEMNWRLRCVALPCALSRWPTSFNFSRERSSMDTRLARFPSKRNRLRWQAANHGCHCFDRASYWLLLAGSRAEHLVRGQSPPEAENLLAFGCPTEAANLPNSPYFANSLNSRYLWYISQKNWRYCPRWHGQYCVSTEKQFGIVLLVMCEVALQSRLNQHKL